MELTSSYIDSLAPNASTVSNGKALAKGKFLKLYVSEDDSILFGECQGSGSKPYVVSVDFIDKANPVPRCTCPSRQIPCKHTIGLMYAYIGGKAFETAQIPEDILAKREKIDKRQKTKKNKVEKDASAVPKAPTKAQMTAATKRVTTQLEGILIAEKLLKNIVQSGLSSIDAKSILNLQEQAKQLGNYYISGIQTAFQQLLILIQQDNKDFTISISQVLYLQALLKTAKEHLENKLGDPEKLMKLDASSSIEELMGHVWKLEELSAHDKHIPNAEVVQLNFYSFADDARKEFVDEGYFICLNNGLIFTKKNYRPYKALKYVKEDDTIFDVLKIDELYIYPGDINPRGRWEGHTMRVLSQIDLDCIRSFANSEFVDLIKKIKNQLKNPLADKNPVVLINITEYKHLINESNEEMIQVYDQSGSSLLLSNEGSIALDTLNLLKQMDLKNKSILVMFQNNIETGYLTAKPLSIITDQQVIRLCY